VQIPRFHERALDYDPIKKCDPTKHRIVANLSSNRVFEYVHAREIKKVKDDGTWTSAQLETIVHPNEYFKRSYLLKNLGKAPVNGVEGDVTVKGEAMEE
jgi:DNA primase large subunit